MKQILIALAIIFLIIAILPIPLSYDDGGTRVYYALTYQVISWEHLYSDSNGEIQVYENTCAFGLFDKSNSFDEKWEIEKNHNHDLWQFWLPCSIIIPALMMILGFWMNKFPPRKINRFFGYRTKRSMKNSDTWNFAHRQSGKTVGISGVLLLIFSLLFMFNFCHSNENTLATVGTIITLAQTAILILAFLHTEIALKNAFHDDGTKK